MRHAMGGTRVIGWRLATVLAPVSLLASCAVHELDTHGRAATPPESAEVAECRAALAEPAVARAAELDAERIRLLNWNAQKNRGESWQQEFLRLARDKELVLVQEVSLREDSIGAIDRGLHWSFAPGWRSAGQVTGVLTLSSIAPLARCNLSTFEPLLGTPKATSITRYGMTATDETLVVVNLHAVNFSMGLGAYEQQFAQVGRILEVHDGPVVLSGDFNTWRDERVRVVFALAESLGLLPLEFPDDRRVRMFGRHLDHFFVRGLSLVEASTEVVQSSDHNPMIVTLRL